MESKGMESKGMESKGMESKGMESKGEGVSDAHTPQYRIVPAYRKAQPAIDRWAEHLRLKLGRRAIDANVEAHLKQASDRGWTAEELVDAIAFSISVDAKRLCDPKDDFAKRGREPPEEIDLHAKIDAALAGARE